MGLLGFLFGSTAPDENTMKLKMDAHREKIIQLAIEQTGCERKDISDIKTDYYDHDVNISRKCLIKDKYQLKENDYNECYFVIEYKGKTASIRSRPMANNVYTWRNTKIGDNVMLKSRYNVSSKRYDEYSHTFDMVQS